MSSEHSHRLAQGRSVGSDQNPKKEEARPEIRFGVHWRRRADLAVGLTGGGRRPTDALRPTLRELLARGRQRLRMPKWIEAVVRGDAKLHHDPPLHHARSLSAVAHMHLLFILARLQLAEGCVETIRDCKQG